MEITAEEVIDRARMYAQDDFNDNKGAILKPVRWFQLFNSLYRKLYKRWLRSGLISPAPVDREFTGPRVRLPGVLAIQGVCRATVSGYANIEVDLFDYLEGAPHKKYRIKDYTGSERPVFIVQGGLARSLTMVGNVITLTYVAGVTTVLEITGDVFASSFMELVTVPDDGDETILDDIKPGYWSVDPKAYGGEVLMTEWTPIRGSQRYSRDKAPFAANIVAPACRWEGSGVGGGDTTIKLVPADNSSQTYVVRYFELPPSIETNTEAVIIPDGADDYLALKLAEMAMMTEGGASKTMKDAIFNNEAELGFAAAEMQPPRLKGRRSTPEYGPNGWLLYRHDWAWL